MMCAVQLLSLKWKSADWLMDNFLSLLAGHFWDSLWWGFRVLQGAIRILYSRSGSWEAEELHHHAKVTCKSWRHLVSDSQINISLLMKFGGTMLLGCFTTTIVQCGKFTRSKYMAHLKRMRNMGFSFDRQFKSFRYMAKTALNGACVLGKMIVRRHGSSPKRALSKGWDDLMGQD